MTATHEAVVVPPILSRFPRHLKVN
jgi:hypothetical protein